MSTSPERLPLSALLSHALIAFIIEFDNEFERQMPHRTTNYGSTPGSHDSPWLVSMVMWSKFMRFIPEGGIPVRELQCLLPMSNKSLQTWLTRLGKWWGYLVVEPVTGARSQRIHPDAVVRPTLAGRKAQAVWRPLTGTIEKRWQQRFGNEKIDQLRNSLWAVASKLDAGLPDSLPILGYGLFSTGPGQEQHEPAAAATSEFALPALLSKVLLAFAIEFENESEVSLAIAANILRLVGERAVRVRDLPRLAAVSKEAVAMSLSFLQKRGYAVVEPESPGGRAKVCVLTPKGRRAYKAYLQLVWTIEERWQARLSNDSIYTLRQLLESLVGESTAQQSPLFRGLDPYPDGWRALIPKPEGLPHYPMVLHRGGFPDGS